MTVSGPVPTTRPAHVPAAGRGWRPTMVLAALTCALLAGCASIPSAGSVQKGPAQVDQLPGAVAVPEGPQTDDTTRGIVEGFLLAATAGLTGDFQVARQFLDSDAAAAWDPLAGATVTSAITLEQTSAQVITADLQVVGKLDADGRYTESSGGQEQAEFTLTQVGGQWRISSPPTGLLVSQSVFEQQYRSAPVYFLTPDTTRLVPDVRWFPTSHLATSVMTALLAGPSPWLRDAVVTAVPDGVQLKPQAVPVADDGTATVVLQPAATVQAAPERALMLAQIQASLDLPGVSSVQVRAGQGGVLLEGAASFPDAQSAALFGVTDDKLVQVDAASTEPVAGVGSLAGLDLRAIAVNDSGTVRVGLSGADTLVRLPTDSAAAQVLLHGAGLARPSVDRFGWAWTGEAITGAQLRAVGTDGTVLTVAATWLSDRVVEALRVSRDGTRVAVVSTGSDGLTVDVAGVVRDGSGRPSSLGSSIQVGAGVTAADQVVWQDPSTLVLLGRDADSSVLTAVPVSGPSRALASAASAISVAADVNERTVVVATSDGQLLRYSGRTWVAVSGIGTVTLPCYPG